MTVRTPPCRVMQESTDGWPRTSYPTFHWISKVSESWKSGCRMTIADWSVTKNTLHVLGSSPRQHSEESWGQSPAHDVGSQTILSETGPVAMCQTWECMRTYFGESVSKICARTVMILLFFKWVIYSWNCPFSAGNLSLKWRWCFHRIAWKSTYLSA